jgi:hypothetical protein
MTGERHALLLLGLAKSAELEARQRGRLSAIHPSAVASARTLAWKASVSDDIHVRRNARKVP